MHRREFICGVAGAVTGAPSLTLRTASAQQAAKVRRIGILMGSSESDSGGYFAAFVEELARLGWTDGRNVRFEQRWTNGDTNRRKRHHLGPPLRRNPLLVIERGSPIVGHRACRSATVVLNILNGPRGARAEFLAPHVTHGRKRPQSVAGASPVR